MSSSKKMKVINFNLLDLLYQWPHACHGVVYKAVQDSCFFEPSMAESLSLDISEYVRMRYYFSSTAAYSFSPRPPCIVFVAEVTRTMNECVEGCRRGKFNLPATSTAPAAMPVTDIIRTCSSRDQVVLALFSNIGDMDRHGQVHDVDDYYNHDDDDDDYDMDFSSTDDEGIKHDDLEEEEEEFDDVVRVLRSWRGVDRTYPVEPLCNGLPVGLILVEPKLEMATFDQLQGKLILGLGVDDGCAICLDGFGFDDGVKVVRTECGHVFHNKCIFNWLILNSKQSCPLCRSSCLALV
ncbi:hypothetical protein Dimus_025548 [Dionaea muscipula]